MSLLRKPELNTRWNKLLLVVVALLLLVPCVAAAAFAMPFDVDRTAQDPGAQQEKERKEKETVETMRRQGQGLDELRVRMVNDPEFRKEIARKQEVEMEMRSIKQAALVQLAKVNMDQAIQIATSQQPGKVLICSLDAKGWEEPGKLAKDGVVFYHVIIADETNAGATHIWVNAIDGTIMKTEKELPRKRSPEGQ
jgi:uncharacterized membrane protein YkoI